MATDPQDIRKRISQIYSDGAALGDDGERYPIEVYSVTPTRGEFVYKTALESGATSSLEVGMAWGMTSLCILEALVRNGAGERAHVIIDAFQSKIFHNAALRSIRELGLASMVEFHEERSEYALPHLAQEERKFDFVFIDGDHSFAAAFVDIFYAHRMLKPGGVMVLDDVHFDPVYMASRFLELNYRYSVLGEVVGAHRHDAGNWEGFGFSPRRNGHPAPRDSALERPCIRAYRKPETEIDIDYFDFIRFQVGDLGLSKAALRGQMHALNRAGLHALEHGRSAEARRYFLSALGRDPANFKTYLRLARTLFPAPLARALSGRSSRAG
jgi:predicted O-methyltransferase YrrM